jgi:hypothetical protein
MMSIIFSQKLNYYTMTKKSIIYPFLVLMTIGSVSGGELKMSTNQSIITIDENLNEWVLVKEENGIKVYLQVIKINEDNFISIKFENISDNNISFSWTLLNNNEEMIKSTKEVIINSGEDLEVFDPTMQKILDNEVSINDFKVLIK